MKKSIRGARQWRTEEASSENMLNLYRVHAHSAEQRNLQSEAQEERAK
jgi:hypothetical protein